MRHIKLRYELLRQKVYIIIYGSSTVAGRTFDLLLLGVILLSLVLIMMASITRFDNQYHTFFIVSEWIITIFFSIEYILRIISNKKPLSYIFSFYGLVDFLSRFRSFRCNSLIKIVALICYFRSYSFSQSVFTY